MTDLFARVFHGRSAEPFRSPFSTRGWQSGHAPAFQADHAGSTPAPRSIDSARPLDAPTVARTQPGLRKAARRLLGWPHVNAAGGVRMESGEAREGRGASPGVEAPGDCFPHLVVDPFHTVGNTPGRGATSAGKGFPSTRPQAGARATRLRLRVAGVLAAGVALALTYGNLGDPVVGPTPKAAGR